jgi:hypothetical protein
MAARLKGNINVRQIHRESFWDDVTGWTTVVKWQGLWPHIDLAKTNDFYVEGASKVGAVQNGDQAQDGILTVTFAAISQAEAASSQPTINEFSNTWTLSAVEEEQNIEQHKNYRKLAAIAAEKGWLQRILVAIQEYKNKVANGIANQTTDKDLVFLLSDYVTMKGTAAEQTLADEIADLILEGQSTYATDRFALRNVRVVPGNTDITASHANTREMWSNSNVTSLISSGAAGITQSALIGNIANTFAGTYWLKLAPTIDEMTNGRYQIVTEFINHDEDEFSTFIHPKYE